MKKVMILGASYTQTPLYEAAKRLGIATVAASIQGDYPGFSLADEYVYADIAAPEEIVREAKRLKIDGIATCGLDLGMRSLGGAAEALGIPGPSRAAAERAGNKWKMKQALWEAKVPTAPFFCIHTPEELEEAMNRLSFPVILKAVDQMGSRGIFRSNTKEEARENFVRSMESTRKDYCLIEEFIEGEMFGVEGMIQNNEMVFLLPNNTENFYGGATPTPVGHSVPYDRMDTLGAQICSVAEKAVRALGLDQCPVNLDMIVRDDQVYVIELTGRSGATGLSEIVSAWYGMDYYEMILRLALGEDVSPYFGKKTHPAVLTHTLMSEREGIVEKIEKCHPSMEGILDASYNIAAGDTVRPYTNGRDRIGQIFVQGNDLEECRRKLWKLQNSSALRLQGDLPVGETPIQRLLSKQEDGNEIYVKREDLLPFSFGGNKVRFAQEYLEDYERQHKSAMILYGGYSSNLCRILAAACHERGIPCSMVYNIEDTDQNSETFNRQLIEAFPVRGYPCIRENIAEVVLQAMEDFRAEGLDPYYIHGDQYGRGNVCVPMKAYVHVYQEILRQQEEMGVSFDYLVLASSTNTTQSGLLAAHLLEGDDCRILGISVNRSKERAEQVMMQNLEEYREKTGLSWRIDPQKELLVDDGMLLGGYGCENESLRQNIMEVYRREGIPLDPVYTGKAFYGMLHYLREHEIRDKKILFLHTGGMPMFYDYLQKRRG